MLLKDVLELPDVEVSHLVQEAAAYTLEKPLPYLLKTLQCIHVFLARGMATRHSLDMLKKLPIWPLRGPGAQQPTRLGTCERRDEWFVADHDDWQTVFGGVVPILAFHADEQRKIYRVMVALDLNQRFITNICSYAPSSTGTIHLSTELTRRFRSFTPFIARQVSS
jgi:hypothetical protein